MSENELDHFSVAIHASLANFTKSLVEESSERYSEMRKCSFFDSIPDNQLSSLAEHSEIKKFASDVCITTENTPGTSFFVILFGTATAFVNKMNIGIIHSGECIGESTFFVHGHSSSATVVANGEVVALELRKNVVDNMSGEVKTCMDKALLYALFKKLQRANKLIEILIKEKSK